jgi:hypothetical protein
MINEATEYTRRRKPWIDALASGEYKQGKGALKRGVKGKPCYCSLGVACEVNRKILSLAIKTFHHDGDTVYEYGGNSVFLPSVVQRYLGISPSGCSYLMTVNDSKGWSFETIKQELEVNPSAYFEEGTY